MKSLLYLDDYEEGVFTPSDANVTLSAKGGRYTKIGNIVHYVIRAHYPSSSSGSAIQLSGLPYTSTGSSTNNLDVAGGMTTALVQNANDNYVGYVQQNSTNIVIFNAGTATQTTYADISGHNVYIFGHYYVNTP